MKFIETLKSKIYRSPPQHLIQSPQFEDGYVPSFTPEQTLPYGTYFGNGQTGDRSADYYNNIDAIKMAAPYEGWDAFCEWIAELDKVARIIRTESENSMMFNLKSSQTDTDQELIDFKRSLKFSTFAQNTVKYLRIYGRVFIQVIWHETESEGIKELKHLYPRTIRIFRNHTKDINDLQAIVDLTTTEYVSETPFYVPEDDGSGDIVAFVQTYKIGSELRSLIFQPDELIFIPRYPSFRSPNGISLIKENYLQIVRKLKAEHSQGIMIDRHGDPPTVLYVPEKWWSKRNLIKNELKYGIKEGMNIILPIGAEHKIFETRGSPEGVIKAQSHLEKQFTSGMGFADSFTDSENSNRSIGDLHLIFYERDIEGERNMIKDIFEEQIIDPHFKTIGYPGIIDMEFIDLTPPDEGYMAYVLAPLVPYMSKSQIVKYFAKIGMAPSEDEIDDLCKRLYESAKPNDHKTPPTTPKTKR